MKRFITLLLMLSTLITFTQKVMAFAPASESEMASMVNCSMSIGLDKSSMDMNQADCKVEMADTMDCQNDCDFMTVVSVLYFINHDQQVNQPQLRLTYQADISTSPYYFPESLYRPPFVN